MPASKRRSVLTEEQVAFFRQNGFLAVDQLTTEADVAFIREIFDRLFEERVGREDGNQFDLAGGAGEEELLPQIMHPARYAPALNESQLVRNASVALSQLFGTSVEASFFRAIQKPPKHGAETPWHQDAAYWPPGQIHRKISVWVPLQAVTVENGCMQFMPGSHHHDALVHQPINKNPKARGLEIASSEQEHIRQADVVPCPLPPGGATFHGGYTLHYAGPNRTDTPRRAIILEAELPAKERREPRPFPWLEERQTARHEQARQDPNLPEEEIQWSPRSPNGPGSPITAF